MRLFGKKKKEDIGEEDYFIDLVPPDKDVPRESLKEKPRPVRRSGSTARRRNRREKEIAADLLPEEFAQEFPEVRPEVFPDTQPKAATISRREAVRDEQPEMRTEFKQESRTDADEELRKDASRETRLAALRKRRKARRASEDGEAASLAASAEPDDGTGPGTQGSAGVGAGSAPEPRAKAGSRSRADTDVNARDDAAAKPRNDAAARSRTDAGAKQRAGTDAAAVSEVQPAASAAKKAGGEEDEDEAAIRAEDAAFEERKQARKRRITERQQRIRLTMLLSVMFAVVLICILAVFFVSRQLRKVELPMMWSNETMAYSSAGQSAMQSKEAFSSDLCIGANNVTLEGVELEGSEKGALFSLDDKTVVFSKDMFEKVYPASITKLMTAILALKSDKLDETVTITWQDLELESGSQVVGLRIGDVVSMKTLMRGLLIHSGNDAAQAIARVVGGTQEKFVEMMNQELRAIGATGSHFTNPTGLHDENHYTTIYDIYLMLHEAMKYDEFVSIIQVPVYDFQYKDAEGNELHVTLDSTDRYLTAQVEPPKDVTVLGGKTGTTAAAGNCLSLISQNAYGQFYISVIVNALSKEALYADMNKLLTQINL